MTKAKRLEKIKTVLTKLQINGTYNIILGKCVIITDNELDNDKLRNFFKQNGILSKQTVTSGSNKKYSIEITDNHLTTL